MELKDFIKQTLKQVTEAVQEATEESNSTFFLNKKEKIEKIDFEIGIALEEETKGQVKANIVAINGNVDGKKSESNINKINFSVYVKQEGGEIPGPNKVSMAF